jgi:spore coat protein CotH
MDRYLACALAWILGAYPGEVAAAEAGESVFGTNKVIKLHIKMEARQLSALTPAGGGGGFGPPGGGFGPARKQPEGTHRNTFGVDFPWSQCELTLDGKTLKDVGIRYKGNYTYMATSRALKKSFKIDLDKHVDGQKLDGLSKLNLNCGVSDPTMAREAFAYAYFRAAGVPAPRTSFAEVLLTVPDKYDNELVGVFTLVEQVNKTFLKHHFKDGKGMLLKPEGLQGGLTYLGKDWKAYESKYKPKNSPGEAEKKRLIAFTSLISNGSDAAFEKEIGSYLDVDAFLRFLAVNALLSNLDSYLGYGHNFYLYLVPSTKKFVFIPWDLDLSLATWPAAGTPEQLVELSLAHPHAGKNLLIDRLFAIKAHKERYLEIVKDLVKTSFTREKLVKQLDEIEKALKAPMAREARAVAARREGRGGGGPPGMGLGMGQFGHSMPPRRFIDKRLASVTSQLAGKSKGFEPRSIGFGPPGGGGGFGPPKGGFGPPGSGGRPRGM